MVPPEPNPSQKNAQIIHQIRAETGGDDAEALACILEDPRLSDDGTVRGRVDAVLLATEHRWFRFRTFLDIPGLYEVKGASDRGFRPIFYDPWPQSRDQMGHFLTAVGLELHAQELEERRLGLRLRDLAGVPGSMSNREAALRLIIGHEKVPDPYFGDPLILWKVRRQFASATDEDLAAFERAVRALGRGPVADLEEAQAELEAIQVGTGRGNSPSDLLLSAVGVHVARRVRDDEFEDVHKLAAWIRRNLKA